MKKEKGKRGARKRAALVSGAVLAFLLVLCLFAGLVVNGYLDKIQYDMGTASVVSAIGPEPDDVAADSPAQEIEALDENAETNVESSGTPPVADEQVQNILLIGSDNRVAGAPGRSDAMILLSINKKTSKIVATSLLRDIYLQIPGIEQGNRLNAAYAFGGAGLLLHTIQENFKIPVENYIAVDFFSFVDVIDKLGGVSIDISDEERKVANEYIKEINWLKGLPVEDGLIDRAGAQILNGKQTLGYVRIRYVGNADFGRTDRQRLVLEQVFSKIKAESWSGQKELLDTFLPEVRTNLSKGRLLSLAVSLPSYSRYTLVSRRVPEEGTYSYVSVRKMSVLKIDFSENIEDMRRDIYG